MNIKPKKRKAARMFEHLEKALFDATKDVEEIMREELH